MPFLIAVASDISSFLDSLPLNQGGTKPPFLNAGIDPVLDPVGAILAASLICGAGIAIGCAVGGSGWDIIGGWFGSDLFLAISLIALPGGAVGRPIGGVTPIPGFGVVGAPAIPPNAYFLGFLFISLSPLEV